MMGVEQYECECEIKHHISRHEPGEEIDDLGFIVVVGSES
jgi:hypothetical protein